MDHVTFRRIREEKLGWTQERLGAFLGLGPQAIRRYETAPIHPSSRNIHPTVERVMDWIERELIDPEDVRYLDTPPETAAEGR